MLPSRQLRKTVSNKKIENKTATSRKATLHHALKYYQSLCITRIGYNGLLQRVYQTLLAHKIIRMRMQKEKEPFLQEPVAAL